MNKPLDLTYYHVTCSELSKNGITSDVQQAVDAGCRIVQYREKTKSYEDMLKEARNLQHICNEKALFLINDHVDIATAVHADGVHLGQDDSDVADAREKLGDTAIIGRTVHNEKEAQDAESMLVDYIGLAPIFKTTTKKNIHHPCGITMISRVASVVSLPIVAVGGITREHVEDVITAGADGVVAISDVITSGDVYETVKDYIRIIKKVKKI